MACNLFTASMIADSVESSISPVVKDRRYSVSNGLRSWLRRKFSGHFDGQTGEDSDDPAKYAQCFGRSRTFCVCTITSFRHTIAN